MQVCSCVNRPNFLPHISQFYFFVLFFYKGLLGSDVIDEKLEDFIFLFSIIIKKLILLINLFINNLYHLLITNSDLDTII